MAISPYKTFAAGEILTAADLNASFTQITSNGESLAFPCTTSKDFNGVELILDADGDTSLRETADDVLTVKMQNVDVFVFDGDVASPVNGLTFRSSATGVRPAVAASGSDTNIGIDVTPKGSGAVRFNAAYTFPTADGTAGKVLKTNGSGALSFEWPEFTTGGTVKMPFYMATAPTGWTAVAANDRAMRVVSSGGTGGSTGGTNDFSTVMAQTTVGNTTLTESQIPVLAHGYGTGTNVYTDGTGVFTVGTGGNAIVQDTIDDHGSGGAHNHTITLGIKYADVILASKD